MKSNKDSKKKTKYADFENTDFGSKSHKRAKKERGSKRRLSSYDEFDDNLEFNDFNQEDDLYER